jgi:hypothetical protein
MAGRKRDPSRMVAQTKAAKMPLQLRPVGVIRSILKTRREAPKQGSEGAPDAWLEVNSFAAQALDGISTGDNVIVVTWLHRAKRDVLKVLCNQTAISLRVTGEPQAILAFPWAFPDRFSTCAGRFFPERFWKSGRRITTATTISRDIGTVRR